MPWKLPESTLQVKKKFKSGGYKSTKHYREEKIFELDLARCVGILQVGMEKGILGEET
jgi:hypothetical protein